MNTHPELALVDLLKAQLALFARLEAVRQRQSQMVSNGNMQKLLSLLIERRDITADIGRHTQSIAAARQQWLQQCAQKRVEDRKEVDDLFSELERRVQDILQRDAQDARHLRARKSATLTAIEKVRAGREASSAYSRTSTTSDRKRHLAEL